MNANLIYGLFWILFIGGMLYMHLGHRGHGAMGGMGCGGGHADHSSHEGHNAGADSEHPQTDGPTGADAGRRADVSSGHPDVTAPAGTPVILAKTDNSEPHHHATS